MKLNIHLVARTVLLVLVLSSVTQLSTKDSIGQKSWHFLKSPSGIGSLLAAAGLSGGGAALAHHMSKKAKTAQGRKRAVMIKKILASLGIVTGSAAVAGGVGYFMDNRGVAFDDADEASGLDTVKRRQAVKASSSGQGLPVSGPSVVPPVLINSTPALVITAENLKDLVDGAVGSKGFLPLVEAVKGHADMNDVNSPLYKAVLDYRDSQGATIPHLIVDSTELSFGDKVAALKKMPPLLRLESRGRNGLSALQEMEDLLCASPQSAQNSIGLYNLIEGSSRITQLDSKLNELVKLSGIAAKLDDGFADNSGLVYFLNQLPAAELRYLIYRKYKLSKEPVTFFIKKAVLLLPWADSVVDVFEVLLRKKALYAVYYPSSGDYARTLSEALVSDIHHPSVADVYDRIINYSDIAPANVFAGSYDSGRWTASYGLAVLLQNAASKIRSDSYGVRDQALFLAKKFEDTYTSLVRAGVTFFYPALLKQLHYIDTQTSGLLIDGQPWSIKALRDFGFDFKAAIEQSLAYRKDTVSRVVRPEEVGVTGWVINPEVIKWFKKVNTDLALGIDESSFSA